MSGEAPLPSYPTFNNRLIACAIDLLLILLVALPISDWFSDHIFSGVVLPLLTEKGPALSGASLQHVPKADPHLILQAIEQNLPQLIFINVLQIGLMATYMLFFWFRYSATPGKMLLRMEIKDAVSGERMTRSQAVKRFLGYFVSGFFLTLGFIWVLFNKKRRGWHDFIAHTVVVKKARIK